MLPDLHSALANGIMNCYGQMKEPVSGRTISLADAVQQNLIIEVLITPDTVSRVTRISETYRLRVESVLNVVTKEWLSLEHALDCGLISRATGEYIDELSGRCVPLDVALESGGVKGKLIDVVRKKEEVSHCAGNEAYDVQSMVFEGQQTAVQGRRITTSRIAAAGSLPSVISVRGVMDPATGREISVKEAVELGLLDPVTMQFIDQHTGEKIPLDRAIALGLIVADVDHQVSESVSQRTYTIGAVRDPATGELIHPSLAVARGLLDMARGVYVEPITGKVLSLAEAMEQGLIQAEALDVGGETLTLSEKIAVTTAVQHGRMVFRIKSVRDPSTGELLSPEEAVNRGLLDTSRGLYIDPITGTTLQLHEAFEAGLIDADEIERQPESVVESFTAAQDSKSFTIVAVVDPRTNVQLTVSEAMDRHILDNACCIFTDPRNGQQMSVRNAIDKGFVIVDYADSTPATSVSNDVWSYRVKSVIDPQTGEEIPLADAVRHQIIDKANGIFWNMKTNERIPIEEAVRQGLVVMEPVEAALLVRNPRTGKEFDPIEAERRGLLNKLQGVYIDPATGDKISLQEAIGRGLISGTPLMDVDYEKLDYEGFTSVGTRKEQVTTDISSVRDPMTGEQVRMSLKFY
jgi:Plectin repeat